LPLLGPARALGTGRYLLGARGGARARDDEQQGDGEPAAPGIRSKGCHGRLLNCSSNSAGDSERSRRLPEEKRRIRSEGTSGRRGLGQAGGARGVGGSPEAPALR